MKINALNIEEYIIEYIEGDLDPAMVEALLMFIQKNPEYQKLLEVYQSTILIDDEMPVVFDNKDLLIRTASEEKASILKLPKKIIISKVAAILLIGLLSGLAFLFINNKLENTNQKIIIAQIDTNDISKNKKNPNINTYVVKQNGDADTSSMQSVIALNKKNNHKDPQKATLHKTTESSIVQVEKLENNNHYNNVDLKNFETITPTITINEISFQSPKNSVEQQNDNSKAKEIMYKVGKDLIENEGVSLAVESIKEKINTVATKWNQTSIKLQFGEQSIYLKK